MEKNQYLNFIEFYLNFLQDLLNIASTKKDPKYLAELRIAERSFNFLLDRAMFDMVKENVSEVFGGSENLNSIKAKRDKIAREVSDLIENDPQAKERYVRYCEELKNPRQISAML